MATFEVKVVTVDSVVEHPNADRLTLVKIGGYTCIANKHEDGSWRYHAGDLVVYIPENAVIPDYLLQEMDMWNEKHNKGVLAGKHGNRVKAIKLRGIFSEGLLYPVVSMKESPSGYALNGVFWDGEEYDCCLYPNISEGDDVADALGIIKYEPVIPSTMDGVVFDLGFAPIKFDLEPIERYPDLFRPLEPVVITEKLHGTFTGISIIPGLDHPDAFPARNGSRDVVIYSKGLGAKGLVFKNAEENATNIYVQAWNDLNTDQFWDWYDGFMVGGDAIEMVHILGETYGRGIQDLNYGSDTHAMKVFLVGATQNREVFWGCPESVATHTTAMGSSMVPILYNGPFDPDVMISHRDGVTTLGGDHIREGVVIYSMDGRVDPLFGYVRLKAVSPDYKLRRGGTEYN